MVHGSLVRGVAWWKLYFFYSFQLPPVYHGYSSPSLIPLVQPSKLDPADCSVNRVQPRSVTDSGHGIFAGPGSAAVSNASGRLSNLFIACNYHAAATEAMKRLLRRPEALETAAEPGPANM